MARSKSKHKRKQMILQVKHKARKKALKKRVAEAKSKKK